MPNIQTAKEMDSNKPNNKEKIIGASILILMVGTIIWLGGLHFLTTSIIFVLLGLFGIYLYSFRAENWFTFLFSKVPANILFNPFYLILLLKSWTMLDYKDKLDELDKRPRDTKKYNKLK